MLCEINKYYLIFITTLPCKDYYYLADYYYYYLTIITFTDYKTESKN